LRYTTTYTGNTLGAILLCSSSFLVLADNLKIDEAESIDSMTPEQAEAWFNDDAEERALAVNEGKLEFLSKLPDKDAHHSQNTLILDSDSLSTGWVELIQCHSQLDAVPEAQIVYRYRRMKNLRVDSFLNINRVWVKGDTVQLENIQSDARLCIRAEVGIMHSLPDGSFVLKNGPFHRKFLDGYYPMQVTLDILFPRESIRFESITPQAQSGFTVRQKEGELHVNAWFEGELTTEIRFTPIALPTEKVE
jgi:hypothetical protein